MGLYHLIKINPRRQLRELYYFSALFSFAYALIAIFEPIFLYQQGFPLYKIALYYALHYTLYVLVMPLGAKVAAWFGLERSLALAMPMYMMYLLILASLPWNHHLYWLAIILLTTHKIFYWPAYHAEFMRFSNSQSRGLEISWIVLISSGLGVLAPALGGIIILYSGYPTLFVLTSVLLLTASIPLLLTTEHSQQVVLPYTAGWRIIFGKQHRRLVLGMIGFGENLVDLVFWPLWMFIVLRNTATLGMISSLAIIVATLLGFMVGDLNDRYGARRILRRAVPLLMGSYLLRLLVKLPIQVLGTDIVSKSAYVSMDISVRAQLYKQGKHVGALPYTLAFETVLAVTKALVAWGLVLVFMTVAPTFGFTIAFAAAAVFSLFYLFL